MRSTDLSINGLLMLMTLFTGCRAARVGGAANATDSSRSAPVLVDPRSDEKAIRAVEARWREVIARKDTGAIASFYTADAIYAPQDRPAARGRDAVAAMWATHEFTLDSLSLERTPIRIEVARSGDVATEVGTWVFHGIRGKKRIDGHGIYAFAWRKDAGQWKASTYIWNTGAARVGSR
jgi:ketosteroid isomerase-like protein